MGNKEREQFEIEEGREETAHVVRDVITTAGLTALASAVNPVAGIITVISRTIASIDGVEKRKNDREG